MAQVTELSVMAIPGRTHSFSAKSSTVIAEGIDFSLGPLQLEFSLPTIHEFSEPNEQPEFSL